MHPARSGDRNVVGGDRHLPDRGLGYLRRGDRYTLDRWLGPQGQGSGGGAPPNLATGYSLTGPSSGNVSVASGAFTVALIPSGGSVTGPVTITPSDLVAGGVFTPSSVQLTTAAPSATFTYTPGISGTRTISCTNNKGLTDPSGVTYVVAAPPFDPTTIAGLKGWWKADAITTSGLREALAVRILFGLDTGQLPQVQGAGAEPRIAGGDPVGTWPDSSGNGKNLVSTFGSPPTFVASGVNGKPIVRFTGEAYHILDCSSFPLNQPDTIIVVAKKPNVATNGILMDQAANDSVNRQTLQIAPTTGFFGGLANPTGGLPMALSDTINHQGVFHIFVGVFNGASSSLLVDGILTASGDIGAANLANMRLQSSVTGGMQSELDMAEILIYDHALSTTDRQNVEAYLKAKYSL